MKKAKEYVDIVHGKLGRILKIDESGLTYYPYYTSSTSGNATGYMGALGANASSRSILDPNIQLPLGKVSIVENVVVTWILQYVWE